MNKRQRRRNMRFVELERLQCVFRNAEIGIGTTMDPNDIRIAGNSLPPMPLPKIPPKYEKPNS